MPAPFDGKRFSNPGPPDLNGFRRFLRWRLTHRRPWWPKVVEAPVFPPPPARVEGSELRVTVVNHATVLIQTQGLNILTDPIWSGRASPVSWLGPKRVCPPGIALDQLPSIDAILISHNHYDHLSLTTLRALAARHRPRVFAPLKNAALIRPTGFGDVVEMDWDDEKEFRAGVSVACVPARHWSARTPWDRNEMLWAGWVLRLPGGNIFFAGDTGNDRHFEDIARRFAPIRLALLPIGAHEPRWFMKAHHLAPEEAALSHKKLNARTSVAIHYDTFSLGDEAYGQAPRELKEAFTRHGVPEDEFWALRFGEGRSVAPAEASFR